MLLLKLPTVPRTTRTNGKNIFFKQGEHVHEHFFVESLNSDISSVKLFSNFTTPTSKPFKLKDFLDCEKGTRFLGVREAKYFRKNPERIRFEWFANYSGLSLPIYFLGDIYTDTCEREYIVSLNRTHIGVKRSFVPTDVLIGGLGEYPKILMYK